MWNITSCDKWQFSLEYLLSINQVETLLKLVSGICGSSVCLLLNLWYIRIIKGGRY